MKNITYKNIDKLLLKEIPEFCDNYKQLVDDFGSAAQTHIVFGELTRFLISKFKKMKLNGGNKKDQEIVERILSKSAVTPSISITSPFTSTSTTVMGKDVVADKT